MNLSGVVARSLLLMAGVCLLFLVLVNRPERYETIREGESPLEPSHKACNTTDAATVAQPESDVYLPIYKKRYPSGTDPEDPNATIYITSASEFLPNNYQWFPEGSKVFEQCPNLLPWMKCSYSFDGHDMDTVKRAHAVLFHSRYMKTTRPQYKGLPPHRDAQQKWIFYESEVPPNTWNCVDKNYDFWTMFNLTATVTSDSDIPLHHFHMKCQPKPNFKPSGKNYTASKSKMAAWFVSHCVTSSKREVYAEELSNFLEVDIYGACGNTTMCSRKKSKGYEHKRCMYELIERDYWFYLSFENAFCDEYVTEKFHQVISKRNVIPIVLGAADYANIFPRGSYIDIRDFGSVKDLAEFLIQLTKDPDRYNAYIEKAHAYDCKFPLNFECNLCEYLHQHRYETQVVLDAQSFWSMEERCVSPKDFYRTCAPEIIPKIQFLQIPDLFI